MAKAQRNKAATPEQKKAEALDNQEVVETTKANDAPVVEENAETTVTEKGNDINISIHGNSATTSAPIAEKVENVQEGNVEVAPEKLVSCMGLKNHTARIGGKIFEVVKDKVQSFPPNVAVLLQRSGHLIVK